jgi:hypothetical protein
MKKTPKKLMLRSETVRTLANMDLARVVGGFDTQQCAAVLDTGLVACATGAVVIATEACG